MVMCWCHFLSRDGGLGGEEVRFDVGGFVIVENGNYGYFFSCDSIDCQA